jgi:hypothetical protein
MIDNPDIHVRYGTRSARRSELVERDQGLNEAESKVYSLAGILSRFEREEDFD